MIQPIVDMSTDLPHRLAKRSHLAGMLTALLLSGSASFSPDGGMATVAGIAGETLKKDVVSIRTTEDAQLANDRVRRLLARPLTVDSAVQLALLNNRGLQAVELDPAVDVHRGGVERGAVQRDLVDLGTDQVGERARPGLAAAERDRGRGGEGLVAGRQVDLDGVRGDVEQPGAGLRLFAGEVSSRHARIMSPAGKSVSSVS